MGWLKLAGILFVTLALTAGKLRELQECPLLSLCLGSESDGSCRVRPRSASPASRLQAPPKELVGHGEAVVGPGLGWLMGILAWGRSLEACPRPELGPNRHGGVGLC